MVAVPQPNPRRRPMTLPTPPPVNRGAGIMALPMRRPTALERKRGRRFQYPGDPTVADPRSFSERMAEGAEVLQGIGAGMAAGVAGLPADLTGIAFGDVPAFVNKLITGETINQEESPYFRQLNEFRETYGAEGVMRAMGLGNKIDAPSDSPDALSRAGINPFRQGAFFGEFVADPFVAFKGVKFLAKAAGADASARSIADSMGFGGPGDPRRRLLPFLPETQEALDDALAAAPVSSTDDAEVFTVRMPNGQEVEGSEDDLRRLYVQAQAAERLEVSQQQQLEQLDQQFAAEGVYDSDATDPDFRIDSTDGQFGFAPNIRQEELDIQYGTGTVTMNPDILAGGLPGGDGTTIFNYVPGLTDGDMVVGTSTRPFSFYEFQEDMYDITGRRIPAGSRIAWPESMSDEFQNLFHNSAPEPQARPTAPAPEVRASAEPTPPPVTAAEDLIEGTATEIVSDTPQAGFTGVVDTPLIPTDSVMPMTASRDTEVARHSVMTRDAARQGDIVDYSPMYQLIDRLPDNAGMSKEEVLNSLRGGFGESLKRDREGSKFVEFLEKHAPNQLYRGQVIALYRDYTPQLRVKTLLQSEVSADAAQGGPVTRLVDYGQNSIDSVYGEQMHIYLSNPNSTVPFIEGQTVQTRGGVYAGYDMRDKPGTIADHNIGASGGPGTTARAESGVPGYFGHIRLKVITDGQGRRIGVLEELQSNATVAERKFAMGRGDEFRFLTGEERYNLDTLAERGPDFRQVFEDAAQSRAQSGTATFEADFLNSLETQLQDTTSAFGGDLVLIGGVRPSPTDTTDTIVSVYEAAPTGVPSNLDPRTDIAPVTEVLSKLMTGHLTGVINDAELDRIAGPGLSSSQIDSAGEFSVFRIDARPPSGRSQRNEAGDLVRGNRLPNNEIERADSVTRALRGALIDNLEVSAGTASFLDAEDIATLNRVILKRAQGADTIDFASEGGDVLSTPVNREIYRDIRDAAERGEQPLDFLLAERNPGVDPYGKGNFDILFRSDPGLFGFLGSNVDEIALSDTNTSVAAMVQRNLQQRITTDVAGTIEQGVFRPTSPEASIAEMNQLIDESALSAERGEELKRSFETWVNTINDPDAADAYRPGTPFAGKSSDAYFNQFAVRLALAEAQKKGLDGVIFPNWEDFRDAGGRPVARVRQRDGTVRSDPDVIPRTIYEDHVSKGLKQIVDKNDIVELETIEAVNSTTGNLERPQVMGRDHKPARAVYFGDRIRTRNYRPEDRPSPNERTYEVNLGPLSDVFENKVIRRAKGGPVDLRPKKLVHSGIGGMARQVM